MSAAAFQDSRRRGRAQLYWWMVNLVLPVVNVALSVFLCLAPAGPELPLAAPVVVVLAVAGGVFLWRLSHGVLARDGRARRLVIGLAAVFVLSFVYAIAAWLVYI